MIRHGELVCGGGKMLLYVTTWTQAWLYMIYVYFVIALKMCGKVLLFSAVLFLRLIDTGQAFTFRKLYHRIRIIAWLSIFLKWEPTFFSQQVKIGLYPDCLNETKAVDMEIQQICHWTQPSISARDWMQTLSSPW